ADRGARRQPLEHCAGPLRHGLPPHGELWRQQGPDPRPRPDLSRPGLQPAQGQLTSMLANFFVPILDDGWRFIAIFAAVTFLAALTGVAWLFWPLFGLTLWSIYFFRDPSRGVPQDDDVLVAPADG